jgi:hypothetical protein
VDDQEQEQDQEQNQEQEKNQEEEEDLLQVPARKRDLTTRQLRFVAFYDGNASEAARKAGYKGKPHTVDVIGYNNMQNPRIIEAIQKREEKRNAKDIASREERQQFWTRILRGQELQEKLLRGKNHKRRRVRVLPSMNERLKASELLGRSECDFTDKNILEGALTLEDKLKKLRKIADSNGK